MFGQRMWADRSRAGVTGCRVTAALHSQAHVELSSHSRNLFCTYSMALSLLQRLQILPRSRHSLLRSACCRHDDMTDSSSERTATPTKGSRQPPIPFYDMHSQRFLGSFT